MSDLSNYIAERVQALGSEEKIRALVDARIEKTIEDSVDKALHVYGPVGKQISDAVTASLKVTNLDLPAYGVMLMNIVRAKISERIDEIAAAHIAREVDEMLNLGAREVKLSSIVKQMVEGQELHERFGSHVTCIVEYRDRDYTSIGLDEESRKSLYECEAQVHVNADGKIYHLVIHGVDMSKTIVLQRLHDWKRTVMALYATGGKLIVDEDHVSTAIGDF